MNMSLQIQSDRLVVGPAADELSEGRDEDLPPGGFRGDEELPPGGFRA